MMSHSNRLTPFKRQTITHQIGVGLRHPHYEAALSGTSAIDFVEVHSENFFAHGGATQALLQEVADQYPLSLHSTSMGLGSAVGVNQRYLQRLAALVARMNPILVSDHASFSWGVLSEPVHAGDLLPLEFTKESLRVLIENVDQVQQQLGRQILVENISSYLQMPSALSEPEFLIHLAEATQCGLLIDLNNLLVNAHNFPESPHQQVSAVSEAKAWLDCIPTQWVGEIHLAGYSQPSQGGLVIDDHSQAVSDECWELYAHAIGRFGPVTTLVEWDNNLPEWPQLVEQAVLARAIADECLEQHSQKVIGQ